MAEKCDIWPRVESLQCEGSLREHRCWGVVGLTTFYGSLIVCFCSVVAMNKGKLGHTPLRACKVSKSFVLIHSQMEYSYPIIVLCFLNC